MKSLSYGGKILYNIVLVLLVIVSVLAIIAVMVQPSKQQDALNALSGGAGELFSGHTKKRGFEAFMERLTSVLLALFFILAIILAMLTK